MGGDDSFKAWEENGIKFRVERRKNRAGAYISCFVQDSKSKKFGIVFPEGKTSLSLYLYMYLLIFFWVWRSLCEG